MCRFFFDTNRVAIVSEFCAKCCVFLCEDWCPHTTTRSNSFHTCLCLATTCATHLTNAQVTSLFVENLCLFAAFFCTHALFVHQSSVVAARTMAKLTGLFISTQGTSVVTLTALAATHHPTQAIARSSKLQAASALISRASLYIVCGIFFDVQLGLVVTTVAIAVLAGLGVVLKGFFEATLSSTTRTIQPSQVATAKAMTKRTSLLIVSFGLDKVLLHTKTAHIKLCESRTSRTTTQTA